MSDRVVIVGGGGHAAVVREVAEAGGHTVLAFLDAERQGTRIDGVPVVSTLPEDEALCVVLAIGDNRVRQQVAVGISLPGARTLPWMPALIHPSAQVSPSAVIGSGTVICAGAHVGPRSVIREHCIVNTHAVVEHDCHLAAYSSVAPTGVMGGASSLGEGAFLGLNATLLQGRSVGAWSIVGAGALVVTNVPDMVVSYGSPATTRRSATRTDSPFR